MEKFSINDAFAFGWGKMRKSFLPLLGFGLLYVGIQWAPPCLAGLTSRMTDKGPDFLGGIVMGLVSIVLETIATMGVMKVALEFCDGRAPTMADFFAPMPNFLNYIACLVLFKIICGLGLLLLIVPGIIWYLQFVFAQFVVVDKGWGPLMALRESSRLTAGAKWNLFGFYILVFVALFLGAILFLVGIVPAAMITILATAHVYRQLQAASGEVAAANS